MVADLTEKVSGHRRLAALERLVALNRSTRNSDDAAAEALCLLADRTDDPEAAERMLRRAAAFDSPDARMTLTKSMDQEAEAGEVERQLQLAAAAGHWEAQFNLSCGLQLRDPRECTRLLGLSAEQGDRVAQFQLGKRNWLGLGTDKNVEEARRWYRLSGAQGYTEARMELDQMEAQVAGRPPPSGMMYFG